MAIRFKSDLNALRADLSAGGFVVRGVHPVTEARGRTLDIALAQGTTVCWDTDSNFLWAEGPSHQVATVERFLRRLYEGPRFLRRTHLWSNRWMLAHRNRASATAGWLIRSEGVIARLLRCAIRGVPRFSIRARRS